MKSEVSCSLPRPECPHAQDCVLRLIAYKMYYLAVSAPRLVLPLPDQLSPSSTITGSFYSFVQLAALGGDVRFRLNQQSLLTT